MTESFQTKVLNLSPGTSDSDAVKNNDNEVINQLKEKFNTTTDKSVRMQILTTLPKSWTLKTIELNLECLTLRLERQKNLHEKGVMSSPDPKPGRTLDLSLIHI